MSYENKGQIPVRAIVSRDPDRSGNFVTDGTDGGAVLNAAMNYVVNAFGGGGILLRGAIFVDDVNVLIPALTSDLILQGEGRAIYAANIAGARASASHLEFQGTSRITNALGAWNTGRLIIRDMGITFNACITNTPMLDVDYTPIMTDNVLFFEINNTVTNLGDAVIGTPSNHTPQGNWATFKNTYVYLKSANAHAYALHAECTRWEGCELGFGGDDQVGIELLGVVPNRCDSLYYWLDENAEGCKVFELFNEGKKVVISALTGSTQAGAGLTTPNILFGVRAGETFNNLMPSYIVHGSVLGSIIWGTTPTAPIYLWENADAQEQTRFSPGSSFQQNDINPPQKTFICASTAENAANPGATPGAAFALNLEDEVDLRYVCHARVSARAQGNEAGNNKGVNIYDVSTGAILCDTGTWAGNAVTYITGPWTNVTVNVLRNCNAYGYSDSGTEDIDCWKATLELR